MRNVDIHFFDDFGTHANSQPRCVDLYLLSAFHSPSVFSPKGELGVLLRKTGLAWNVVLVVIF